MLSNNLKIPTKNLKAPIIILGDPNSGKKELELQLIQQILKEEKEIPGLILGIPTQEIQNIVKATTTTQKILTLGLSEDTAFNPFENIPPYLLFQQVCKYEDQKTTNQLNQYLYKIQHLFLYLRESDQHNITPQDIFNINKDVHHYIQELRKKNIIHKDIEQFFNNWGINTDQLQITQRVHNILKEFENYPFFSKKSKPKNDITTLLNNKHILTLPDTIAQETTLYKIITTAVKLEYQIWMGSYQHPHLFSNHNTLPLSENDEFFIKCPNAYAILGQEKITEQTKYFLENFTHFVILQNQDALTNKICTQLINDNKSGMFQKNIEEESLQTLKNIQYVHVKNKKSIQFEKPEIKEEVFSAQTLPEPKQDPMTADLPKPPKPPKLFPKKHKLPTSLTKATT